MHGLQPYPGDIPPGTTLLRRTMTMAGIKKSRVKYSVRHRRSYLMEIRKSGQVLLDEAGMRVRGGLDLTSPTHSALYA
jgi:hypothetical protein